MATPTVGEAISAKVAAVLTSALAPVTVERFRLRPYEQAELPAVAVTPDREEVEYGPGPTRLGKAARRHFRFVVRISVPGDPADEELDSLRASVIVALMADRSLGSLALGISETHSEWEAAAGSDFTYGVLSIGFEVEYQTTSADARVQL
jgi:hypothetical protein